MNDNKQLPLFRGVPKQEEYKMENMSCRTYFNRDQNGYNYTIKPNEWLNQKRILADLCRYLLEDKPVLPLSIFFVNINKKGTQIVSSVPASKYSRKKDNTCVFVPLKKCRTHTIENIMDCPGGFALHTKNGVYDLCDLCNKFTKHLEAHLKNKYTTILTSICVNEKTYVNSSNETDKERVAQLLIEHDSLLKYLSHYLNLEHKYNSSDLVCELKKNIEINGWELLNKEVIEFRKKEFVDIMEELYGYKK